MRGRRPGLDPELEALVRPGKIARRAPAQVRARALARARAIVAAGGARHLASVDALDVTAPARAPRRRGRVLIAVAASAALAAASLVAVGALRARTAPAPHGAAPPAASAPAVSCAFQVEPPGGASPAVPRPAPVARPVRRAAVAADAVTAELELLQRAHAAYTRAAFSTALVLIGEHARRFPNGHLAEEREALRVRALQGAGRTAEAHRAAAGFAARFPRSVLLPRGPDAQNGLE